MKPQGKDREIETLVAAARKLLWRGRLIMDCGPWLLTAAIVTTVLAVVHRGITALPVALTLAASALLVAAITGWRIAATRPHLKHVLHEADRLAGSDALIASAWPLLQHSAATTGWPVRRVLHDAQHAARGGLEMLPGEALPHASMLTRLAAAGLAAALLVLALPGRSPDGPAARLAQPTRPDSAAGLDSAGGTRGGEHGVTQRRLDITPAAPPEAELADTAAPPIDLSPASGAASASTQGGSEPGKSRAEPTRATTAAPAPQLENIDISRRGPRSAAAADVAAQRLAADPRQQNAEPAAGAAARVAPPVDADPAMRQFLANWQRSLENEP